MSNPKLELITEFFKQWGKDITRAENLFNTDDYFFEGLLVLSCYIGALARHRYPQETKDWKSYKKIVSEYSGQNAIYENIDLLFFYQWPRSKLANAKTYKRMTNHSDLVALLQAQFGDEDNIRNDPKRYQKREDLLAYIESKNVGWFDEANFMQYIELFSNNQILYEFLRCEAVHNADFQLFSRAYQVADNKQTYEDNHQINRAVILATVKCIVEKLKSECLGNTKWPQEL
ncbi:MAG: hypothetical protein DID89_2727546288 [Candidatus Nitrotoga sp. CP45]|nr:MAG: hypothetical protein DID89_2727546288 [Candidatus Nitrotoga sp. CP45]